MLTEEQIKQNEQEYTNLLLSTERKGIDGLLRHLQTNTDFFTAPASSKFHNNFSGGLALHCLNVYKNFKALLDLKQIQMDEDSIIITSLLHDICKCNYYVKEQRNRKKDGKWESYDVWASSKSLSIPLPHSARSVRMLRGFIQIKFIEELVIFYHMGPFGGEDFEYRNLLKQVNGQYPQTLLFYTADLISSYLDEDTIT